MFLNQPHNSARYVSKIFDIQKEELFKDSDNEVAYYVAALTHYRFNSLVNSRKYGANKYSSLRWHIYQIFKFLIHGKIEDIKPNSNKMDIYCQKIIKQLTSPAKEYENIFKQCIKIIDSIEFPTRDTLKRAKYNQDLLEATKAYLKKR